MDWIGIAQFVLGALVGGVGVYLRYKSRIDFERHEMFKRRLDALNGILQGHSGLIRAYEEFIYIAEKSAQPDDVTEEAEALTIEIRDFDETVLGSLHLIPDTVADILISERMISLQRKTAEFDQRRASHQERFVEIWRLELVWHRDLVDVVRKELSMDRLHEETRKLIGKAENSQATKL